MKKKKQILHPAMLSISLFLVGIMLGGTVVHSYFNTKYLQENSQKNNNSASLSVSSSDSADYQNEAAAYIKFKTIKEAFMPMGIPRAYGKELNISFDEVQDAINKVRIYGPTYGSPGNKINLSDLNDTELKRYKEVGSMIACEFCCGVKTLTKEDGTAACGCAHSIMMRGLSAYLIQNHPELSNGQILTELGLWKRIFFPKQTLSAELAKLAKQGEPGIEQILKEFPDFLPQMVGGC